jgi:hypothetical protein
MHQMLTQLKLAPHPRGPSGVVRSRGRAADAVP